MEFILYGLFAVGEGWGNKEEWGKTKEHSWVSWVCAVLVLTGITVFATSPEPAVPSNLEIKMKESVLSIYQQGEYHLALDNDLPLMAGKPIWYQPTGMLSMFQTNVWDPSPLLRDIQNHKFATIEFYDMPHQYLYPPIVEQAVLRNYHIHWKAFGRVWYVPNLN